MPCSFVDPSVIRELIDGFNESRRHIASGVGKTADALMRAILFRTTPKVYLLHYSSIFRNPEPLGTWMNNVAFSRLGEMLHLDIQKWKEAMKTSKFQKYLGGTTVCMNRLAMATKGWEQLTSNDT